MTNYEQMIMVADYATSSLLCMLLPTRRPHDCGD
jgi:hypothetical protein